MGPGAVRVAKGEGGMARGRGGALARLWEGESVAGLTDGQLLDRFAARRGSAAESAFEALVTRHGPMVARVCRACLRDEHDSEDAFQATFLVLVRRADSIGERDLLGPWLYGVAHRVARKARAVAARRRGREGGPTTVDPPARSVDPTHQTDLAPVLHEEVNRLPEKYRRPVILCHLQGLTHAEAARELAWPVGTVSVRLVRARKLLADRLTRRGVSASTTLVAASLTAEATAATLTPSWATTTTLAMLAASAGSALATTSATALSAGAATLARRTSMTMFLSAWKWLTIPAAVALTTATGAALIGPSGSGDQPAPAPTPSLVVTPPTPTAPQIEFPGPGPVIEQSKDGMLDLKAESMVVRGTMADLAPTVERLRQSNPRATYQLMLSGGKLHYQGESSDKNPPAEPYVQLSPIEPKPEVVPPLIVLPGGTPLFGEKTQPPEPVVAASPAAELSVDLSGEETRITGQPITYKLVVRNTGNAPTEDVLVSVKLPQQGGRLANRVPTGAGFDTRERKLIWKVPRIEPDQEVERGFVYQTTTPGFYRSVAEVAAGPLQISRSLMTSVVGFTDLDLQITQTKRRIALGETTSYDFQIKNFGSKKATGLKLEGTLTNLKVNSEAESGKLRLQQKAGNQPGQIVSWEIPNLDAGQSVTLRLKVEGIHLGQSSASVKLTYDKRENDENAPIHGVIVTTITDPEAGTGPVNPGTEGGDKTRIDARPQVVPPLVVLPDGTADLGNPPPTGYFDLPASDPSLPGSPQPVKVGQVIDIELLEGLPGRPITGQRVVRSDGTISLGYYGDLHVVGLNRDQIKVKLLERLRAYLKDQVLGLVAYRRENEAYAVPPVRSDRVFVDDQPRPRIPLITKKRTTAPEAGRPPTPPVIGPVPIQIGQSVVIEVLEALVGRPLTGEHVVRPDGTISLGFYGDLAVAGLTRDEIKVKAVGHLRKYLTDEALGLKVVNPRTNQVEAVAPLQSDRVFVDQIDDWHDALRESDAEGKVRVGQVLAVEVLEGLPGRPITGQRMVELDGRINLGFYGNVAVAGLTRNEVKAKVIEHLRGKLTDAQLGLVAVDARGAKRAVAPADSDRVFVDDEVPDVDRSGSPRVTRLQEQVADLSGKLDTALDAIERIRRDRDVPAPKEPTPAPVESLRNP